MSHLKIAVCNLKISWFGLLELLVVRDFKLNLA